LWAGAAESALAARWDSADSTQSLRQGTADRARAAVLLHHRAGTGFFLRAEETVAVEVEPIHQFCAAVAALAGCAATQLLAVSCLNSVWLIPLIGRIGGAPFPLSIMATFCRGLARRGLFVWIELAVTVGVELLQNLLLESRFAFAAGFRVQWIRACTLGGLGIEPVLLI
jgi:hypothetical protein